MESGPKDLHAAMAITEDNLASHMFDLHLASDEPLSLDVVLFQARATCSSIMPLDLWSRSPVSYVSLVRH